MAIDLVQLRQTGVYESRGPIPALQSELAQIKGEAVRIQAVRKKLRWASLICLLTVVLIPVAIGLFIYSFFYGVALVAHQERIKLLEGLLVTLRNDCGDRGAVSVKLSIKSQPIKLREEPFPQKKKGKQQFLKEEWLSIHAPLMDGTDLHETVTDLIRKRSHSNPRGKTKTKTKTSHRVLLRLRFPQDLYGDPRPFQNHAKAIKAPGSTSIKAVKITEKWMMVKASVVKEDELARTCVTVLLGAYKVLNLSRRAAAQIGAK